MFIQQLKRIGDESIIIPSEVVEQLGLQVGEVIGIEIHKPGPYQTSDDVAAATKWALEHYAADFDYLNPHAS